MVSVTMVSVAFSLNLRFSRISSSQHHVDASVLYVQLVRDEKRGNTQPRTTKMYDSFLRLGSILTNPVSMMNEYKESPKDVQSSLGAHWKN